ncbi:MAG: hypothetical protein QXI60_03205 [Thermofilaceae archaeon]
MIPIAKINDYTRKDVITYKDPGKKCPYCNCYFITNVDLESHIRAIHWKKGNGYDWMDAKEAPDIKRRIAVSGEYIEGPYKYTMKDGKIIRRRIL